MAFLRTLSSLTAVVAAVTVIGAVQMALIAFGNLTDYDTNYEFVVHVLAMDTTFQSPATMWRAITDPGLATAAYVAIIAWEAFAALVLVVATVLWIRALAGGRDTGLPRRWSTAGWLMWVLLFGGGFIAIGGEWFQMWQSADWNGLRSALRNLIVAAVGLILTHLPDRAAPGGRLK